MDYCICGVGFNVYEGKTCESASPPFIIGMLVFGLFVAFTSKILYIAMNSGDKGAPWIFDKNGNNLYRMRELKRLKEKKRRDG